MVAVLAHKFGPKLFVAFLGQGVPQKIPQQAPNARTGGGELAMSQNLVETIEPASPVVA